MTAGQPWAIYVVGALAGTAVSVWVSMGGVLQALAVVQGADFLSGLLAAGMTGTVQSDVGRKGLIKKATIWLVVGVIAFLNSNTPAIANLDLPVTEAIAGSFIVIELVSLLENARTIGVPLGPLNRVLAAAKAISGER